MPSCTFDSTTRLLRSKAQEEHSDIVCPHLAPGLQYLLTHGSQVSEISRMAWSLVDLDIVLDRAEDPRNLPTEVREGAGAEAWVNFDSHYPLYHGLVCTGCRQTLGWPHHREPEDS